MVQAEPQSINFWAISGTICAIGIVEFFVAGAVLQLRTQEPFKSIKQPWIGLWVLFVFLLVVLLAGMISLGVLNYFSRKSFEKNQTIIEYLDKWYESARQTIMTTLPEPHDTPEPLLNLYGIYMDARERVVAKQLYLKT